MTKRPKLTIPAVIAGLVLLVLAAVYFIDSADALPSFLPGHEAGSAHHHVKHGIAALILAIGAFLFAWFQTGGPDTGRPATR